MVVIRDDILKYWNWKLFIKREILLKIGGIEFIWECRWIWKCIIVFLLRGFLGYR